MRREDEVKRAAQAFETAVDHADKLDAGVIRNQDAGAENGRTDSRNGSVTKRGPRPPIPVRSSIADYSKNELVQWLQWVSSDGQLRTDDEIVAEMVSVLGFSRRGSRIEAAIRNALRMCRAAPNPPSRHRTEQSYLRRSDGHPDGPVGTRPWSRCEVPRLPTTTPPHPCPPSARRSSSEAS